MIPSYQEVLEVSAPCHVQPLANKGPKVLPFCSLFFSPSPLCSHTCHIMPSVLSPVAFTLPLSLHSPPLPFPPCIFLPMDDTGSPCSNFTLSSWHPLKWCWALGPRWPDSTLALGPLNANKDRLWIIDSNTTNEETPSKVFYRHINTHTHTHTRSWNKLHAQLSLWLLLFQLPCVPFSKTNILSARSISCRHCVFLWLIQTPTGWNFFFNLFVFLRYVCSTSLFSLLHLYTFYCCFKCLISVRVVQDGGLLRTSMYSNVPEGFCQVILRSL